MTLPVTTQSGGKTVARLLAAFDRSYSRINTIRNYARFVLTNALQRFEEDKPHAVVYLDHTFPDLHDRRYFFLILQTLTDAGYWLEVVWKISFAVYRRLYRTYEHMILQSRGLRIVRKCPKPSKSAFLFTNVADVVSEAGWKKVFQVDCDVLTRGKCEHEILMPYFMHPEQYKYGSRNKLAELRELRRSLRIFFSGNIEEECYGNPLPGKKLNRFEIVKGLRELPGVIFPSSLKELHESFSRSDRSCVIYDRRNSAIADEDWLRTIARCDFFLCLPGSSMPMCHNVIEAMAVGTIPILNYTEWFDPPLTSGKNCLEFNSLVQLEACINQALELHPTTVNRLRQNVIEYYEEHLSPIGFRNRLEDCQGKRVRLSVNTEYPWNPWSLYYGSSGR